MLLGNLKELYIVFKTKFPTKKVVFSKFCSLKPKSSVTPESSGHSTDTTELITQSLTIDDYKVMLWEAIDKLTSNFYIPKSQTKYLKEMKEKLEKEFFIALVDFAENHVFVFQDEIQCYHCSLVLMKLNPSSCTLNEMCHLEQKIFCFFSGNNDHDTCFVFVVQNQIVSYLKTYLITTKINYFSDGCAA